jgi:hypothetical protein
VRGGAGMIGLLLVGVTVTIGAILALAFIEPEDRK